MWGKSRSVHVRHGETRHTAAAIRSPEVDDRHSYRYYVVIVAKGCFFAGSAFSRRVDLRDVYRSGDKLAYIRIL